jgi:hypothetical protein
MKFKLVVRRGYLLWKGGDIVEWGCFGCSVGLNFDKVANGLAILLIERVKRLKKIWQELHFGRARRRDTIWFLHGLPKCVVRVRQIIGRRICWQIELMSFLLHAISGNERLAKVVHRVYSVVVYVRNHCTVRHRSSHHRDGVWRPWSLNVGTLVV